MDKYRELQKLKKGALLKIGNGDCGLCLAPDMGGRIFAHVCSLTMHRIDLENAAKPDRPFNNFGGNNFWPAPEGGKFGFNYRRDEWYVADSFEVLNPVSLEEGLLAGWTLEQFDANEDTVSFCLVENPQGAINFNFYEHPGDRIVYYKNGFTYRTDGLKKGQIGIKKYANPQMVGFFNLEQKTLCIRQNLTKPDGDLYFNIADNEQPAGPFSAADSYSIFNSGPDMGFFELETIDGADIQEGQLTGSHLTSLTAFAVFEKTPELENWVRKILA